MANVRGLPIKFESSTILYQSNEYLDALKLFSEEVKRQFTIRNLPAEKLKPIEESMKELTKEVEGVHEQPEKIDPLKKKSIDRTFVDFIKAVIKSLPATADDLSIFRTLYGFNKIIGGDIQQTIEAIQNETHRSNEIFETGPADLKEKHSDAPLSQSTPALIISRDKLIHKHVRCSDRRDIGYIAGASDDTITVLSGGSQVYRIPKSYLVSFYGGDVMINLSFKEWKDIRYNFLVQ